MNKLAAALLTALVLLASCGGDAVYEIAVVSSQPYLVSGSDALVRVTSPGGVAPGDVTITLN